jgi:acylphosphatase
MEAKESKECLHALVDGRVQGVGFRQYVMAVAVQLGVNGWVRNLDDGRVEVMAEGNRSSLEELIQYLQRGPSSAFVTQVTQEWLPFTGRYTWFNARMG